MFSSKKRRAAWLAAGLGATAALGLGGGSAGAVIVPSTAPGVEAVNGGWYAPRTLTASDRPECQGNVFDPNAGNSISTFRESKETWTAQFWSSDSRYSPGTTNTAVFYLHILRNVSITAQQENGAVDGTFATFDDANPNVAVAQGVIQGVLKQNAAYDGPPPSMENFNGLLYGGQVLRPSGATIGIPHLVANFEGIFGEDNTGLVHNVFFANFGGADTTSTYAPYGGQRPAVIIQGGCTGNYAVRPSPFPSTLSTTKNSSSLPPSIQQRQADYVQHLYDQLSTGH